MAKKPDMTGAVLAFYNAFATAKNYKEALANLEVAWKPYGLLKGEQSVLKQTIIGDLATTRGQVSDRAAPTKIDPTKLFVNDLVKGMEAGDKFLAEGWQGYPTAPENWTMDMNAGKALFQSIKSGDFTVDDMTRSFAGMQQLAQTMGTQGNALAAMLGPLGVALVVAAPLALSAAAGGVAGAGAISGGAGQATLVGAGSATSIGAGAAAAAIPEIVVTAAPIVSGVSASTVLTGAAGLVAGTSYLTGGTAVTGQTGGLSQAPTTKPLGGAQTPGTTLSPNTGSLTYNQISGGNLQIWDGDKLIVDTLQGIAPSGASGSLFDKLKNAIKTGMKGKDLLDLASGLLGGAVGGSLTGGVTDFDKTLDDLTGGKKPKLPKVPSVPVMPTMDDRLKQADQERLLVSGGRASTILTDADSRIADPGSRWLQPAPTAPGKPTATTKPALPRAPDRTDGPRGRATQTAVKPPAAAVKKARTPGTASAQPKTTTVLSRPGDRWRAKGRIGL